MLAWCNAQDAADRRCLNAVLHVYKDTHEKAGLEHRRQPSPDSPLPLPHPSTLSNQPSAVSQRHERLALSRATARVRQHIGPAVAGEF